MDDATEENVDIGYYVRSAKVDCSLLENPSQIGVVETFEPLVFASDEEKSATFSGDDVDSNAESYYLNDYPDEDEDGDEEENFFCRSDSGDSCVGCGENKGRDYGSDNDYGYSYDNRTISHQKDAVDTDSS